MTMAIEVKLLKIIECIDKTCSSSVKLFDVAKHTSRSVGIAAYEERQKALLHLADEHPDVIEPLRKKDGTIIKKSGHYYFKFEGRAIKIISSFRDPLGANVFARNVFETDQMCLPTDPLLRVIYKADYDIDNHESTITECFYIEVDRGTGEVINEIDLLSLYERSKGFIEEMVDNEPSEIELGIPGLIVKKDDRKDKENDGK